MKLAINVKDKKYSKALASALSLRTQDCEIAIGSESFDYEIKDYLFMSIDEICAQIDRAFPGSFREKRVFSDNCKFVCFCSANGGSGVTTAALTYARRLSRLEEKSVLFVGITPFSGFWGKDDFGVSYYNRSDYQSLFDSDAEDLLDLLEEESHKWDTVVIDLSFGYKGFSKIIAACEYAVVVYRPWGNTFDTSELYCSYLEAYEGKKMIVFKPHWDDYSFSDEEFDICGEFGAEVAELAKKLE